MTIKELIEKLQEFDPNDTVKINYSNISFDEDLDEDVEMNEDEDIFGVFRNNHRTVYITNDEHYTNRVEEIKKENALKTKRTSFWSFKEVYEPENRLERNAITRTRQAFYLDTNDILDFNEFMEYKIKVVEALTETITDQEKFTSMDYGMEAISYQAHADLIYDLLGEKVEIADDGYYRDYKNMIILANRAYVLILKKLIK